MSVSEETNTQAICQKWRLQTNSDARKALLPSYESNDTVFELLNKRGSLGVLTENNQNESLQKKEERGKNESNWFLPELIHNSPKLGTSPQKVSQSVA